MCAAVAEVCVLDMELVGPRVGKTAKELLKAGYGPEDVRTFLAWWKSDSFRAAHMPVPTLNQLLERIKQAREAGRAQAPGRTSTTRGFGLQSLRTKRDDEYDAMNTPDKLARAQAEFDAAPTGAQLAQAGCAPKRTCTP
jgi:hypothetical protein